MRESPELPYSLDDEEAVLGSILIDSESMYAIDLKIADFFSEQNQLVYQAILELGEGINQITVAQKLIEMGKLDDIGGAGYLSHLISIVPTSLHIEYYAKNVHKCSVNRRIITAASQIANIGYKNKDPHVALDEVQGVVQLASQDTESLLIAPNQLFELGADLYTQRRDNKIKSYSTGIRDLDSELGGLFSSEVTVLASRPGHGKTQLAIQIAQYVGSYAEEPVLFGSLEMHWREILDRMMASSLKVHPRSLRAGRYYPDFYDSIIGALPRVTDNNIYLFGQGVVDKNLEITTESFYRAAYRLKATKGISLMVIDHIGCFGDRYGNSDYSRMGYIAQRIKNIARALDVATLEICQLSRAVEQKTAGAHIPSNKDLRDSGRIEEVVDNILFLYRPEKYPDVIEQNPELRGTARLILTKSRQIGADVSFGLVWNGSERCYQSSGETYET